MIDRGIIKWRGFDSCYSTKNIIKDINKEKNKINMPILSEDQIKIISENIIDAFNLKINVNIEYYYDGIVKHISGKIYNINAQEKKICLNNTFIYFKQILKINYY